MIKSMYSTAEVANILHLSRVEVFRRIKTGKIKAEKIGRNYVIARDALVETLGNTLGSSKKREIEATIDQAFKDYGEVFKKLSRE